MARIAKRGFNSPGMADEEGLVVAWGKVANPETRFRRWRAGLVRKASRVLEGQPGGEGRFSSRLTFTLQMGPPPLAQGRENRVEGGSVWGERIQDPGRVSRL